MLFDLQSTRRRRTTVKIIYGLLALLMVVGLVFLGVGTGSSGIADNNNGGGGSGNSTQNGVANSEIKAANKEITADPTSAKGYVSLEQAYISEAESSSNYNSTSQLFTKTGKADLEQVIAAWNKYQANAKPKSPNEDALFLAAYAMDGAEDYAPATVLWQDIIGLAPSDTRGYECLAADAYASKNTTLGLDALNKAIGLTPKISRTETSSELDELKTAADAKAFAASEECT